MANAMDEIVSEAIREQPPVSPVALRAEDEPAPTDEAGDAGDDSSERSPLPNTAPQTNTVEVPGVNPMFGTQGDPGIFDPDIHVSDEAGLPVKNKDGSFKKKPGRKRGVQNTAGNTTKVSASVVDADNLRLQKAVAAANAVVGSLFILGQVIGGDEFRPIVDPQTGRNEPAMLSQAWTEYFLTCENTNIPPWLGVVIATGAYFIPRCTMPVTRSRLGQLWDWISGFWKGEEKVAETE